MDKEKKVKYMSGFLAGVLSLSALSGYSLGKNNKKTSEQDLVNNATKIEETTDIISEEDLIINSTTIAETLAAISEMTYVDDQIKGYDEPRKEHGIKSFEETDARYHECLENGDLAGCREELYNMCSTILWSKIATLVNTELVDFVKTKWETKGDKKHFLYAKWFSYNGEKNLDVKEITLEASDEINALLIDNMINIGSMGLDLTFDELDLAYNACKIALLYDETIVDDGATKKIVSKLNNKKCEAYLECGGALKK